MKQFMATVWWWIRVLVLVAVGLYALALLWNNSKQTASIWYWPGRPVEETNIMAFGLAAFLSGGLIMTIGWALGKATVNLRRTRAARKKRAELLAREEMERKASMLRVKPAPMPVVRPRTDPKALKPEPGSAPVSAAVPAPVVDPSPEVALAPAPVVVVEPVQSKPASTSTHKSSTEVPSADRPTSAKESPALVPSVFATATTAAEPTGPMPADSPAAAKAEAPAQPVPHST